MTEEQGQDQKRKVGIGLGIGIFFLPFIFSWFTLRKGHSTLSKVLSLGWLGLAVISMAGGGGKDGASQATASVNNAPPASSAGANTPKKAQPAKPPPAPKKDGSSAKAAIPKGDSAVVAGLETTIIKARFTKRVKAGYSKHRAGEGATLVVVDYKVKNATKEAIQAASFADAVIDKNGASFEDSMECNLALEKVLGFTDTLNPGLPKSFQACFEVPENTSGYVLKVNRSFDDGSLHLKSSKFRDGKPVDNHGKEVTGMGSKAVTKYRRHDLQGATVENEAA